MVFKLFWIFLDSHFNSGFAAVNKLNRVFMAPGLFLFCFWYYFSFLIFWVFLGFGFSLGFEALNKSERVNIVLFWSGFWYQLFFYHSSSSVFIFLLVRVLVPFWFLVQLVEESLYGSWFIFVLIPIPFVLIGVLFSVFYCFEFL